MPQFEYNKVLPHNSKEIFDLILDVDSYHQFLPWCTNSTVVSKRDNEMLADMEIEYGWWKQKYRSKIIVTEEEGKHIIDVTAIDGPFDHLHNRWEIVQSTNTDTCHVNFMIDFTINSLFIKTIVTNIFNKLSAQLISAFEERANTIYR